MHESSFFPERAAVLLDVEALLATDDAAEASRIVDRIAKIVGSCGATGSDIYYITDLRSHA